MAPGSGRVFSWLPSGRVQGSRAARMADVIRTYLHLREWSDLAYLLDLRWGFWFWVGVMLVGLVGLLWPDR